MQNGFATRLFRVVIFATQLVIFASSSWADPYPPAWDAGSGTAVHFSPSQWPAEPADPADCGATCGGWKPYTRFNNPTADPRTQDPSNGGTSPQNYVNIASSCIDKDLPSIYYNLQKHPTDETLDVIMFRWRVEQVANTYATGPNPGNLSATDPWNSALWTVLFDFDGDGVRDLAAHLDGSSGSPSTSIDRIVGIWGDIPTQSVDYENSPAIFEIAHNPTAFSNGSTILNFAESWPGTSPTTNWPNGSSETTWDYGTTRSKLVSKNSCTEYFIDYQIPVKMLDASGLTNAAGEAGPSLDRSTPISMLFCTANSLNNPFQKDCVLNKDWIADPLLPGAFGDFISFDKTDPYEQSIVDDIEALGCGNYTLNTTVKDVLAVVNGDVVSSVQSVEFFYYYDTDANGLTDDGNSWVKAADAMLTDLNKWSASWDATGLLQGQYLIGVQALDDPTKVDDDMPTDVDANRTFSYLTQVEVDALVPPAPAGEAWWANPVVTGAKSVELAVNACGIPTPYLSKAVNVDTVTVGDPVVFTITFHNTLTSAVTVSSISDNLPAGFTYVSTDGSTLGMPLTSPTAGDGGTINWTFPAVSVAGGGTGTLVFTANASSVVGSYSNTADAVTSYATLSSDPVQVAAGAPRLTIAKSASPLSVSPSDTVTYTITYSNDSSVDTDDVVITDILPTGMTYVTSSASNGGVYVDGTRTISWDVGSLVAGAGPSSVSFQVTIDDPYPDGASVPLVNTGTINSNQTGPDSADSSIYVDTPRPELSISKTSDVLLVDPLGDAVFTLSYQNSGTGSASGVTLTDVIPAGFTFVSCSDGCTNPGVGVNGTVSWDLGALAAAATGSVTLTVKANSPYDGTSNPATNTATLDSDSTSPVSDSADVGVSQTGGQCTLYYLTDTTGGVGFDGTQSLTNTLMPTGASSIVQVLVDDADNTGQIEVARFYQDPVSGQLITFDGSSILDGVLNYTKTANLGGASTANTELFVTLYDYNPVDGAKIQLAQVSQTDNGAPSPPINLTGVTASGSLPKGHRFLVILTVDVASGKATTFELEINSANSYIEICAPPPVNMVLDKTVDASSIAATGSSRALTYTIDYANTSSDTGATSAVLTDTLPSSGVSFASCSFVGSTHFTGCSESGGVVTFDDGAGSGVAIAAGGSGQVTVTVNVNDDLGVLASLNNTVSLVTTETLSQEATASTIVQGASSQGTPALVISKSVDTSNTKPGETVTYALTVLNTGSADTAAITVTDTIPAETWYTYVASSIAGGDSRDDSGLPNLSWTINSLSPGSSVDLTFQMLVASSGVPGGITVVDNAASATEATVGTENSNTVSVAINTNPQLGLTKTVSPAGVGAPGDTLTYTLVVTNSGDADASDVVVRDPVPDNVRFVSGSITATQGTGSFDAVNNRLVFDVGTLAAAGSVTLVFEVVVAESLPNGTTVISNTATASASNAAPVNDTAASSIDAAPILSVTKTAPASVPFPAATLTADVTASATLNLDNTGLLSVGQIVMLNNVSYEIIAINGQQATLDTTVTASSGAELIPTIPYSILYQNTGDADATTATLTDVIPAGLAFLSGSPDPGTKPAIGSSGNVVWTIGTIATGDGGMVKLLVYPVTTGDYTNNVTLASAETADVLDAADTSVGGLIVRKTTSTPVRSPGDVATYTITVENTLTTTVTSVEVTDTLSTGFTYKSTTSISGAASGPSTPNPILGDTEPSWGIFSIGAGATLTIEFDVDISPNAGAANYQNAVNATAESGIAISPFDPLSTIDEDVTVLAAGSGLVEGIVYKDNDGSGTLTAGDTRFAGIQVSITDSGATLFTPSTDSSGYFSQVVAPGSTIVDVLDSALPAGLSLATGSTDSTTVVVPVNGVASDNTGYVDTSPATLSGTVWDDLDNDGIQDPGEPGIAGVTVTLNGPGGPYVTTTDGNGDYSFTGLAAGDYTVVETNPVTHSGDSTSNSVPVTLVSGGSEIVDFGDYALGDISGTVWDDLDNDGIQDPGEPGIPGVTVTLNGPGGPYVTTTDGNGDYSFTGLAPGDYTVVETNPVTHSGDSTSNSVPVTLASGGSETVDFGDYALGDISGTVWDDLDNDGIQDPGEPGIPGVTVTLNGPGGPFVTTTDSNGDYSFTGLAAGDYTVVETNPGTHSGDSTSNSVPVTLVSGGSETVDFGDYALGDISGTVWDDLDNDGIQDPGEPGIPGVTVTLNGPGGPFVTTTDSNGDYSFTGLAAGDYTVVETNPGTHSGDSTSNSVPVTLVSGGSETVDFGDYALGDISGTVWDDLDNDGIQDPGEPGIPGVTVTLNGPGGPFVTTTDSNGDYSFTGLAAGDYTVVETNPGTHSGDSTSNSVPVTLVSGGSETVDFGDYALGDISGTVWDDLDNDGIQDPGEPGIPGVTVTLNGPGGPFVTTTDSNGDYSFTGLAAGDYTVVETNPGTHSGDSTSNSVPVTLVSGGSETVDFGDYALGDISGTVWDDLDNDGIQDPGEPGIPGVTVTLNGPGGPYVTTTDGNGDYSFTGLAAGDYTVVETNPGTHSGDSTSNSVPVTLVSGGSETVDFGDYALGDISGTVWDDLDNDGIQDPGEPGIPGVTVTLNGPGGPFVTTTDSNGDYSFTGLAAGDYTVVETNPGTHSGDSTSNSVPVTLVSGGSETVDFGDYALGDISGTVWDDLDNDGIQDPGEPGIPGVTVTLNGPGGPFVTTTDSNGDYSFTGLAAGDYTVVETNPGTHSGDSTSNSVPVTLVSGGSETVDFGDYALGDISGTVWDDLDNDGIQDPGEPGIPGVTVTLNGPGGPFVTTTDSNGDYSFTGLAAGDYTVVETNPGTHSGDSTSNSVPVTLVSGGSETVDFGDIVAESPLIGVAKEVTAITDLGGGSFEVDFSIVVENFGNVELSMVQVTDDLLTALPAPVTWSIPSAPATIGTLTANAGFNGDGDQNLLDAANSTLAVGANANITFTVRVILNDAIGPFTNVAMASGESPLGVPVQDESEDGNDPDTDGDGTPDEQTPTRFELNSPPPTPSLPPVPVPTLSLWSLLLLIFSIASGSAWYSRRRQV